MKKYEPDLEWKADRVVAVTRTRSTEAFNTRWSGYDHTFNTNEPRGNLRDAVLVRDFSSKMSTTIDVEHALHLLSDAFYRSACRMRRPELGLEVPVPCAALGGVAHAILAHFTRPPSCAPPPSPVAWRHLAALLLGDRRGLGATPRPARAGGRPGRAHGPYRGANSAQCGGDGGIVGGNKVGEDSPGPWLAVLRAGFAGQRCAQATAGWAARVARRAGRPAPPRRAGAGPRRRPRGGARGGCCACRCASG